MKRVGFVTTKEAVEMFSVSISTICNMLKRGKLNGRKIGKEGMTSNWRVSKKSLEDYIAQGMGINERRPACQSVVGLSTPV